MPQQLHYFACLVLNKINRHFFALTMCLNPIISETNCHTKDHSVRQTVIQQNIFNRYKHFLHITAQWKHNHMLSNMFEMKVQGAVCCAGGLGLVHLTPTHALCPALYPPFALNYILANKAEIHQK